MHSAGVFRAAASARYSCFAYYTTLFIMAVLSITFTLILTVFVDVILRHLVIFGPVGLARNERVFTIILRVMGWVGLLLRHITFQAAKGPNGLASRADPQGATALLVTAQADNGRIDPASRTNSSGHNGHVTPMAVPRTALHFTPVTAGVIIAYFLFLQCNICFFTRPRAGIMLGSGDAQRAAVDSDISHFFRELAGDRIAAGYASATCTALRRRVSAVRGPADGERPCCVNTPEATAAAAAAAARPLADPHSIDRGVANDLLRFFVLLIAAVQHVLFNGVSARLDYCERIRLRPAGRQGGERALRFCRIRRRVELICRRSAAVGARGLPAPRRAARPARGGGAAGGRLGACAVRRLFRRLFVRWVASAGARGRPPPWRAPCSARSGGAVGGRAGAGRSVGARVVRRSACVNYYNGFRGDGGGPGGRPGPVRRRRGRRRSALGRPPPWPTGPRDVVLRIRCCVTAARLTDFSILFLSVNEYAYALPAGRQTPEVRSAMAGRSRGRRVRRTDESHLRRGAIFIYPVRQDRALHGRLAKSYTGRQHADYLSSTHLFLLVWRIQIHCPFLH